MKIIKDSRQNFKLWKKEVTCALCGSELELNGEDLSVSYREADAHHDATYNLTYLCPCCRQVNYLTWESVSQAHANILKHNAHVD